MGIAQMGGVEPCPVGLTPVPWEESEFATNMSKPSSYTYFTHTNIYIYHIHRTFIQISICVSGDVLCDIMCFKAKHSPKKQIPLKRPLGPRKLQQCIKETTEGCYIYQSNHILNSSVFLAYFVKLLVSRSRKGFPPEKN